jgi:hypothetical protein
MKRLILLFCFFASRLPSGRAVYSLPGAMSTCAGALSLAVTALGLGQSVVGAEPPWRDPSFEAMTPGIHAASGAEKSAAVSVRFRTIRYTELRLTRLHSQGARTVLDEVLARELYDYTADPHARRNLAADPNYVEVVAEGAQHVATTLRRDRPEPGR